MKRVVVAPHDPAEFLGGTERVVRRSCARGSSGRRKSWCSRAQGASTPTARSRSGPRPPLSVQRVLRAPNETGEMFLRPRVRGDFEQLLSAIQPDLVEWHHGATLSLDLARAAAEREIPVLLYLHDLWLSCPRFFRIPPLGIECPKGATAKLASRA